MTDKGKEAAVWFLKCFEVSGCVDIAEDGMINVHGSCRARQGCSFATTGLEHKFGLVTGNFSLRSARLNSLLNIPNEVRGTAILAWNEDLPLLRLVCLKGSFILIDEEERYNDDSITKRYQIATKIIKKYQQCSLRRKEAVLKAQAELIKAGFEGNATP